MNCQAFVGLSHSKRVIVRGGGYKHYCLLSNYSTEIVTLQETVK